MNIFESFSRVALSITGRAAEVSPMLAELYGQAGECEQRLHLIVSSKTPGEFGAPVSAEVNAEMRPGTQLFRLIEAGQALSKILHNQPVTFMYEEVPVSLSAKENLFAISSHVLAAFAKAGKTLSPYDRVQLAISDVKQAARNECV